MDNGYRESVGRTEMTRAVVGGSAMDLDPEEVREVPLERGGDDPASKEALMERVYAELRARASVYLRDRKRGASLQPTQLVHEVYLRLAGARDIPWDDRAHLLAICAGAMRNILADHARRRRASKRGGGWARVTLSEAEMPAGAAMIDALALDEAIRMLGARNERQARIVVYRFFAGMTIEEVAAALGVSRTTVDDDWRMARAWLSAHLSEGPSR